MKVENIEKFNTDGYCVIRNALSADIVNLVSQYALFDEMQNSYNRKRFSDKHVPDAYAKYSDPAMESLLLLMTPKMEEVTGLKLHPTYSYFRIYRNGDELTIHKDRPSCEVSTTICFNYSYDSTKLQWPIYIDGNRVCLNPGDMAVYKGIELEHWREPLVYDEPVWHVQTFLHYVNANGPNASWKYDRRDKIGKRPNIENQKVGWKPNVFREVK